MTAARAIPRWSSSCRLVGRQVARFAPLADRRPMADPVRSARRRALAADRASAARGLATRARSGRRRWSISACPAATAQRPLTDAFPGKKGHDPAAQPRAAARNADGRVRRARLHPQRPVLRALALCRHPDRGRCRAASASTIGGAVKRALSLSLAELLAMPRVEIAAVNQCSGNSRGFFGPRVPGAQWGNGAIGNARWTGVRLTRRARPRRRRGRARCRCASPGSTSRRRDAPRLRQVARRSIMRGTAR